MKLNFYKAKHIWENETRAKWVSSSKFDKSLLEEIKNKYLSFTSSQQRFIEIKNKTIFIFYRKKQDIFGRDITELVAIYSNSKIKDKEFVLKELEEKIAEPFDDDLEYSINTKNIKNKKSLYFIILILFSISFIYKYIITDKEENKTIIKKIVKDSNLTTSNRDLNKSIEKETTQIAKDKNKTTTSNQDLNKSREKEITQIAKDKNKTIPNQNLNNLREKETTQIKTENTQQIKKEKHLVKKFCKKNYKEKNTSGFCFRYFIDYKCKDINKYYNLNYKKWYTNRDICNNKAKKIDMEISKDEKSLFFYNKF